VIFSWLGQCFDFFSVVWLGDGKAIQPGHGRLAGSGGLDGDGSP